MFLPAVDWKLVRFLLLVQLLSTNLYFSFSKISPKHKRSPGAINSFVSARKTDYKGREL
jgi:hypothetical protein